MTTLPIHNAAEATMYSVSVDVMCTHIDAEALKALLQDLLPTVSVILTANGKVMIHPEPETVKVTAYTD